MNINWEFVLYSLVTMFTVVAIVLLIYYVMSARMMKKRREAMRTLINEIKPGKHILFAGGIKGKIVRAGDEELDVEIAKGLVITVSRFSVNEVLK